VPSGPQGHLESGAADGLAAGLLRHDCGVPVNGLAALVVNGARASRLTGLRDAFTAMAAARGYAASVLMTTPADSGEEATRTALAAGATVVIAVGGDGTVRACAQVLAGTSVPLAIVSAGSANLTARALGLPRGMAAALETGFTGADRQLDLVSVGGLVCVAMAGIGVDAAVVGATSDQLKRRAGWPAYAAASLSQLRVPLTEFTICLDDKPPLVRGARTVVVGNSGLLPGGFPILPDARPDDGFLDVGVLAPAGLAGWVSVGYRAVLASRRDDAQLERFRARSVEVRASGPLPRQVDGEIIGPGQDLTASVRPGALRVRVTARSRARRGLRPG
jgi:diacylglycerol kinase family enzyme